MHVPLPFRIDRSASLAFAQERAFGVVCAFDGRKPVASWVPFHIGYTCDGTPTASFHLARANPLAAPKLTGQSWMLAVGGADAYVSPRWYASPQQVPTWLYEAVQLTGPVRALSGDELAGHLDALSAAFETGPDIEAPWSMAEIAAGRRAALMNAIVGFEMTIEIVEGSFKLNQHKSDADHIAVSDALARQPEAGARKIAADMRAMRPHVFTPSNTPDIGTSLYEGNMT